MESYFPMTAKRRKIRIEVPPPFKIKVKLFIQNNRNTLLFLAFIVGFVIFYFVGMHIYWTYTYTSSGQGYIYE